MNSTSLPAVTIYRKFNSRAIDILDSFERVEKVVLEFQIR